MITSKKFDEQPKIFNPLAKTKKRQHNQIEAPKIGSDGIQNISSC